MSSIAAKPYKILLFIAVLAAFFGILAGGFVWYATQHEDDSSGRIGEVGGDFTLTSGTGSVSLHDFRGKAVLLFFGYTHCPDICPATMDHVATALERLQPEEKEQVQALFVTVDPERDTARHLAEYVAFFHGNIIGLSGTMEQIRGVARAYMVEFFKEDVGEGTDYQIIHTSLLFLINGEGKVVDMMSHQTAPEDVARAVRRWLNRTSSSSALEEQP